MIEIFSNGKLNKRELSENFLLQTNSTMIQQLLKEHYVMLEKKLKEKFALFVCGNISTHLYFYPHT